MWGHMGAETLGHFRLKYLITVELLLHHFDI